MTFIVNMAAGDANDLWARALARNLVKYIQGTRTSWRRIWPAAVR